MNRHVFASDKPIARPKSHFLVHGSSWKLNADGINHFSERGNKILDIMNVLKHVSRYEGDYDDHEDKRQYGVLWQHTYGSFTTEELLKYYEPL